MSIVWTILIGLALGAVAVLAMGWLFIVVLRELVGDFFR